MTQAGPVVWLTGVPAAGKTTIAMHLAGRLRARAAAVVSVDGDELRAGLCADLGFSEPDREENIRRAGRVAELVARSGVIVICALVSPYERSRRQVRELLPPGRFIEVYVRCPLAVCRQRDPKGLYRRQRAGELTGLTGVDAPYEPPSSPELTVDSDRTSAEEAAAAIERLLLPG